jgi:site-specific DNA recombinase
VKIISYQRVSSQSQVESGVSLEAQEAQIRAWAGMRGILAIQSFRDEGISGFKMDNRPGLRDALAACQKGDVFVVYSLSRFSRSVKDCMVQLDALAKRGVEFVSLSENLDGTTASGRAMIGVIAVFAQFFRDQISEHTKAALSHKRAKGERLGGLCPYGYTSEGGQLKKNPEEQKTLGYIRILRYDSGRSLQYICDDLNRMHIPTRTGVPWTRGTVQKILARK